MRKNLIELFPLAEPRKSQKLVINAIEKAFIEQGKRFVILEAPVGSGKSAIAMSVALGCEGAHILTPRKGLQDQYFEDFGDELVLMKGRSAFPCTYGIGPSKEMQIRSEIRAGSCGKYPNLRTCGSDARCKARLHKTSPDPESIYKDCIYRGEKEADKTNCPYGLAVSIAQQNKIICHNLHGFIYQTSFTDWFDARELMVIDEAHEIEGIIRSFIETTFSVDRDLDEDEYRDLGCNRAAWGRFLLAKENLPRQYWNGSDYECDKDYEFRLENWRTKVKYFTESPLWDRFSLEVTVREGGVTNIKFTPDKLGRAVHDYLFNYGERVLLMSGTIYDKDLFCRTLGIPQDEVAFIKIDSEFPAQNRPIICKPEYMVDTSHANWNDNFDEMIANIRKILKAFPDVKGLIHSPSYKASREIFDRLKDERIVMHDQVDFAQRLEQFYETEGNAVFLSPICQQGVDFKNDRARFQIVLRVPYLNTGDPFVNMKCKTDFKWYNHQALVTFGQMIGRVNRSPDDWGYTILMDERFNKFLKSNSSRLPRWLTSAITFK